jgi:hypothetical protein
VANLPRATKRPHLVSEVVSRRFLDDRHLLTRLTLATRSTKNVGVDGFGRAEQIYPKDPLAFEALWKGTEDRLPEAFAAVEDGSVFGDERLVVLLKDCLAFHLARGLTVARVHRRVVQEDRAAIVGRLATRPWVDETFRRRHSGLWPGGPEGREMVAAELIDEALTQLAASSFTPDRMVALFERAQPLVRGASLEIGVAQEGEFLIGDTPAVSLRAGYPGVGPLEGVPWDRATTIVMPIGRRHVIWLAREEGFVDVERLAVDYLNGVQVAAAERAVAWHPSAPLGPFVINVLDTRAAAAVPSGDESIAGAQERPGLPEV